MSDDKQADILRLMASAITAGTLVLTADGRRALAEVNGAVARQDRQHRLGEAK